MKVLGGLIAVLLLAGMAALGVFLYVESELAALNAKIPPVVIQSSGPNEQFVAVYDADGGLMYRSYTIRNRPMVPDSRMRLFLEMVKEAALRVAPEPLTFTSADRYIMNRIGVTEADVTGFIYNHYAHQLLKGKRDETLYDRSIRYTTVKALKKRYTPEQMYALYLNASRFGNNIWGLEAASQEFFSKSTVELSIGEVAFLMGMLRLPDGDPESRFGELDRFRAFLLKRMFEKGFLTEEQYKQSAEEAVVLQRQVQPFRDKMFVDMAIKQAQASGKIDFDNQSVEIYTTYRPEIQKKAQAALSGWLEQKDPALQGAFVIIDTSTAGVVASVGGKNPADTRNRVFDKKRQIGSTFKPIVYLAAMANNVIPSTIIEDKPYTFRDGRRVYMPKNFEDDYLGRIPLRFGLVHSLNNATIQLARTVGLKKVQELAISMGMREVQPFLSMPLGVFPITPIMLAEAFATIGSYGLHRKPTLIDHVVIDGTVFMDFIDPGEQVVDEIAAFQVLNIMKEIPRIGTARGSGVFPGTAAKTGTTDEYVDAWFGAIFPPYVAVVWVGHEGFVSMGDKGTGGQLAAPVVARFQQLLYGGKKEFSFRVPSGIVFAHAFKGDGKLVDKPIAGSYQEAFRLGNLPERRRSAAAAAVNAEAKTETKTGQQ